MSVRRVLRHERVERSRALPGGVRRGRVWEPSQGSRVSNSLGDRQAARVFYTWSAQANALPLEIVDGAGVRFVTADGARWWDLGSMVWNAGLGHVQRGIAGAIGRRDRHVE